MVNVISMKQAWIDHWCTFARKKNPYCPENLEVEIEGDALYIITTAASYADIVGCPPSGKDDELYLDVNLQLKEEPGRLVIIYKRTTRQGYSAISTKDWRGVVAGFASKFGFTVIETACKGECSAVLGRRDD